MDVMTDAAPRLLTSKAQLVLSETAVYAVIECSR